jgi:hypothetical protein
MKGAALAKKITSSSTTTTVPMNNTTKASLSTSSEPTKRKATTKANKEAPEVKKKAVALKAATGKCRLKKKQSVFPSVDVDVAVASAPSDADPTRCIVNYESSSTFDDLNDHRFKKTLQNVYGNDGDKEKENVKPAALLEANSSSVVGKQPKEKQDFDWDHACEGDLHNHESINDDEEDAASDLDTFQDLFHDYALEDDQFFNCLPFLFGNEKHREVSGMENEGNNGEFKEDWEQRATQMIATEQPLPDEEK